MFLYYLLGMFTTFLLIFICQRHEGKTPAQWEGGDWGMFFLAGVLCPIIGILVFCFFFKSMVYPHLVKERQLKNTLTPSPINQETDEEINNELLRLGVVNRERNDNG